MRRKERHSEDCTVWKCDVPHEGAPAKPRRGYSSLAKETGL